MCFYYAAARAAARAAAGAAARAAADAATHAATRATAGAAACAAIHTQLQMKQNVGPADIVVKARRSADAQMISFVCFSVCTDNTVWSHMNSGAS